MCYLRFKICIIHLKLSEMLEYPFNNPNSCISSCINKHIISEFIWSTIIWVSAVFPRQYDTLTHYTPLYFISQKIFYIFLNFIFNWRIITVLWWFLPYIKMNSMCTILKVFIDLVQYCFHFFFFFLPWGMWDLRSPTRGGTWPPCIRRWRLNHWTTREIPMYHFKWFSLGRIPFVSENSAGLSHAGVKWMNASSTRTRVRVISSTDELNCLKCCQARNRCSMHTLNGRQWAAHQVSQETHYLCSVALAGQSLLFE